MSDGLAFDDLDLYGRGLDDPFEELVQDVVHGLLETYGSNPDVLTRGAGLVAALSGPSTRLAFIKAQIESQLHDDNRVTSATVDIQPTDDRGAYAINIVLGVNTEELNIALVVDSSGGVQRAE